MQSFSCGPQETCQLRPASCAPGQTSCNQELTCIPLTPVDVCAGFVCPDGERCMPGQVQCVTTPCNPVPECARKLGALGYSLLFIENAD